MEAITDDIEVVDEIFFEFAHKFGITFPEQMGIAITILADSCTYLQIQLGYGDEIYDQRVDVHKLMFLDFEVLHQILLQLDPVDTLGRISYQHQFYNLYYFER